MTDRLTLAHAIEDAGIERVKAEALAGAIFEAIHDNVATKVDIHDLRSEMKANIQELRSEIVELRGEVAQLGTSLRAEIAQLEYRVLIRLGGLIVVLLGLLFAALHTWPPGQA